MRMTSNGRIYCRGPCGHTWPPDIWGAYNSQYLIRPDYLCSTCFYAGVDVTFINRQGMLFR